MKNGFYTKLAWNNIKKNYRFFIPRMISEAGLLACFYITTTLMTDERMSRIEGGSYISTFMAVGVFVLVILSTVLMLYTNSFLMKQRKREFGIYNILGMEKKHVCKVMFKESLISGTIAIISGMAMGMMFYKICSLLICRLLKSEIIFGFYFITLKSTSIAVLFFVLLDLFTYIVNRTKIKKMKPVELLESKSAGEKEPKVKWLMMILGLISLGTGYYIALTTKEPLAAMSLFFIAVALVIIGTYFLFISGSIFVLKALRKNKKYYYNKRHMPAVSGLLYRMKQNAVGLASIAILATGVLVMISTTVSLYAFSDTILKESFPQHFYISINFTTEDSNTRQKISDDVEQFMENAVEKNGLGIKSISTQEYLEVSYILDGNTLYSDMNDTNADLSKLASFSFITADTYRYLTGQSIDLKGNEIAVCRISSEPGYIRELTGDIYIHGKLYSAVKVLSMYPIDLSAGFMISVSSSYGVVVADETVLNTIYNDQKEAYGEHSSCFSDRIAVTFTNLDKACETGDRLSSEIRSCIKELRNSEESINSYRIEPYWETRESVIGMYGVFLFLGILLGTVCLFATALIIYYKQISEGYEDRTRFLIMEKIGMSKKEVQKTISSQILLVFFLPLIVSGIHLAFAFPLLKRLLAILYLTDVKFFLICTLITYAIFAIVYVMIYAGTSKTYYKIVN